MNEEHVVALEERVARLILDYQRLQADHVVLQGQVTQLTVGQQLAVARIEALIEKVQQ